MKVFRYGETCVGVRGPPTRDTRSIYFVTYVVYAEFPIEGLSLSCEQDGVLYRAAASSGVSLPHYKRPGFKAYSTGSTDLIVYFRLNLFGTKCVYLCM